MCRDGHGSNGGLGGIKINHKTEALTKDFDVVPGLYCAGNDVNSICGGSNMKHPFYNPLTKEEY